MVLSLKLLPQGIPLISGEFKTQTKIHCQRECHFDKRAQIPLSRSNWTLPETSGRLAGLGKPFCRANIWVASLFIIQCCHWDSVDPILPTSVSGWLIGRKCVTLPRAVETTVWRLGCLGHDHLSAQCVFPWTNVHMVTWPPPLGWSSSLEYVNCM